MVNDSDNVFNIEGLGREIINKQDLVNFINDYNGQLFGIYRKNGGEHVGNVGLNGIDNILRSCSLGIIISSQFKGNGYGFEGMVLVLNHAFNNLNLHRIYLGVVEWNFPAIKLYEKLGFQHEGTQRDAFWSKGSFHKLRMYSILKNDFKFLDKYETIP